MRSFGGGDGSRARGESACDDQEREGERSRSLLAAGARRGGRYYSFTDGDAHVVVLDSTGSDGSTTFGFVAPDDPANSSQARWLERDLAMADGRWTVALQGDRRTPIGAA